MNETDLDRLYTELAQAIKEGRRTQDASVPQDFGYLGYNPRGGFSVVDEANPKNFYVRMKSGTFRSIPHKNSVYPTPGLPIEIRFKDDDPTQDKIGYIYGPNHSELQQFAADAATFMGTVGFHSHHYGSGMEFPIDLRMIAQLGFRYVGDLKVEIYPGWFFYNGQHYLFPLTIIDFEAHKPTTISYQKWVVAGLKRDDKTIVFESGTEAPSITPVPESDIENISFSDNSVVPLFAVKLYQNRSRLSAFDFVAMYSLLGTPSEGFDVADIVTSEGHVVVSDGEVVTI